MSYPIDFVLSWVDGNDPEWLAEKKKYEKSDHCASAILDANDECRYRENGLLRFLFRGIEEFAPWVNRIYFVTCGHKPEWLSFDNPKLSFVTHKDFIPDEYLPTFNSNTIELNYHRIEGLSEHFVIFNDDMFLLKPIEETMLFKNGYPVLDTLFDYPPKTIEHNWEHFLYNDYCILNKSFSPVKSVWENRRKWFNLQALGARRVLGNLERFLSHWTLPVGIYGHLALPHLKSSMIEVWDKYPSLMSKTSASKFRSDYQVNQWLLCAWNQAKGDFYPAHRKRLGQNLIYCDRNLQLTLDYIQNPSAPVICLNETENDIISDSTTHALYKAFETILPNKSSFEL